MFARLKTRVHPCLCLTNAGVAVVRLVDELASHHHCLSKTRRVHEALVLTPSAELTERGGSAGGSRGTGRSLRWGGLLWKILLIDSLAFSVVLKVIVCQSAQKTNWTPRGVTFPPRKLL